MTSNDARMASAAQQWPKVERALRAVLPGITGCSKAQRGQIIAMFKPVFLRYPDAFRVDLSACSPKEVERVVAEWVRGIYSSPQYAAALADARKSRGRSERSL
ncbi:MAG: hypothetical protein ACOZJZ_10705 [Pseudomonadota bacterium]